MLQGKAERRVFKWQVSKIGIIMRREDEERILPLSTGVGVKLNTNKRRRVILFSKVLSAGSFFPFNIIYS